MPDPTPQPVGLSSIEEEAAAWVLRRDLGLAPAEEKELALWLAADIRHEPALREYQAAWDRFEPLAGAHAMTASPQVSDSSPGRTAGPIASPFRPRLRMLAYSLAAAAMVFFGLYVLWHRAPPAAWDSGGTVSPRETRHLADGSVIELNRGAILSVTFTAAERQVRLERGEASFIVARNHERPFIVSAGDIAVRAVGTDFNVKFDPTAVEIIVAEGKVQVGRDAHAAGNVVPLLEARQRAVVSLASDAPPPVIDTLTSSEIEARFPWRSWLLDFDGAPLSDVVAGFNRHNALQIVIGDPVLKSVRVSATFRTDNVDGFLRLIQSNYNIAAERIGENEVVLSKARAE